MRNFIDSPGHDTLEERIIEYANGAGFDAIPNGHHDLPMTERQQSRLCRLTSLGALFYRHSPDLVMFSRFRDDLFACEAKTRKQKGYWVNMDLFTVLHMVTLREMEIDCLCCHADPYRGVERGFWAHEMPEIAAVVVPPVHDERLRREYVRLSRERLGIEAERPSVEDWARITNGIEASGDPYVRILPQVLAREPDWRILIDVRAHETA